MHPLYVRTNELVQNMNKRGCQFGGGKCVYLATKVFAVQIPHNKLATHFRKKGHWLQLQYFQYKPRQLLNLYRRL